MKPEQQIIAIAEACGWTDCVFVESIKLTKGFPPLNNPPSYGTYENGMAQLPNYCNDLNAMHEAEKVLFPKHEAKWAEYMSIVCGHSWRIIWTATAAQRAEAFLRTLDLWKP